jgi:hypothetical protein
MFPHNSRLQIFCCTLITLCLLLSASSCTRGRKSRITWQSVAAVLEEIDEAAKSKDADAIVKHFSKDAQIKVSVKGPNDARMEMAFTRDQYRDYAQHSYDLIDSYEYERTETVIKVNPDGQSAVVADEVLESATTGGQTIRSVTRETATFKLEGGRIVLSSLEGNCLWNLPGEN